MTRIQCETAAQCERLAAAMEAWIEPVVTATVVVVVAAIALYVGYREVRRYDAA